MLRAMYFNPAESQSLQKALVDTRPLAAAIRRTETGVRIKFSDGRLAWLDKDVNVSESGFMAAVMQWARRHGAKSVEVEFE